MLKRINNKILVFIGLLISSFVNNLYADSYYDRRVSLFELLPISENDIVFLGNSITDGGEFSELLGMNNIKNRGITSDVISGVEQRLDQVLRGKPKKIFLLIGINDISHKLSAEQIASEYERLVDKIISGSPETTLYLQSIMPINNDFKRYKNLFGTEDVIVKTNLLIEKIAIEKGVVFIDLTKFLSDDKTGKLKKEFTNDGLHLTGDGYKAWIEAIRCYIEE